MRLDDQRASSNIDDRRRSGGGRRASVPLTGGVIVLVLVVSVITGENPLTLLSQLSGGVSTGSSSSAADDASAVFVSKVLGSTEDTWRRLRPGYREPTLVLFRGEVDSACGFATAASGPFYCPGDHKAYLDLAFFDELARRFGAPGDFAAAYVVAHEIGHHLQSLDGTSRLVHDSGDRAGARSMGVRLELQADCYAGVWAHDAKARGQLEAGDVDEALQAAHAIGDDTLQKQGRGRVVPDSFTHGSSAQRSRWFKAGLDSGDPRACDTFAASAL
jgi:predicted metalloprotease